MNEQTKRELKAAAKVAGGVASMASGVATAVGFGVLSFVTGKHHGGGANLAIGKYSVNKGAQMVKDGLRELRG